MVPFREGDLSKSKRVKRISGLYERIISVENLTLADQKASKGKQSQRGVIDHAYNKEQNILDLHYMLSGKTYTTSEYTTFTIREPKERQIFCLPYFPDRIVHHAIMNIMEPIFVSTFTRDTYSCIKGRGIHGALNNLREALKDVPGTRYCLKMDITKFYPSVDHQILKDLLRKKIKDRDLLWLLDDIIDSADGLPIGNYLSQYLANFYLTYFDHWLKEEMKVKHYFRYADDMVILGPEKPYLHSLLAEIRSYLAGKLKLQIKGNYQVFPVEKRGIDFVGYRCYHTHTLLRKSIKNNMARAVYRNAGTETISSYLGWTKHCNSKNLIHKLLPNERIQEPRHYSHRPEVSGRQDQNGQGDQPEDHRTSL